MAKPTIIFVHGAYHSKEYFDRVIAILEPLGYKCVALSMPAVGRHPPVKSLEEDIATVRSAVMTELDLGNDVVVNAHSWGGIPTASALDGLSKSERASEGKTSSVVKLTFVSAFVLPKGTSLQDKIGGQIPPSWIFDEEGNMWLEEYTSIMYHDLDPEDAKYWVSKLKHHSYATITDTVKSAAYQKIPSAYLICEDDRAIPVKSQEDMIEDANKDGADFEVERLFVSHSPYLAKPDAVAGFLRRAAGESLEIPRY
ncbi:Methylesterase [Lachnellula suecica]|uniref:Methylesterase n=1 Tax=Lachnellula suecica TaxID=602035 RepID=A0A8T9CKP4_9HELO|nr:Methylesterase [Lachnellula suecica]